MLQTCIKWNLKEIPKHWKTSHFHINFGMLKEKVGTVLMLCSRKRTGGSKVVRQLGLPLHLCIILKESPWGQRSFQGFSKFWMPSNSWDFLKPGCPNTCHRTLSKIWKRVIQWSCLLFCWRKIVESNMKTDPSTIVCCRTKSLFKKQRFCSHAKDSTFRQIFSPF